MFNISIDEVSVVKLIVNTMEKINQVMKNITNNTDGYCVDGFNAYSLNSKQIPRKVECELKLSGLNSKQQVILNEYLPYLTYEVTEPLKLFAFIKDYKKALSSIEIYEDEMIINSGLINIKLKRSNELKFIKDTLIVEDELVNFKVTDLDILDKLYTTKGVMTIFIDISNETISINDIPTNSDSYLKITLSHKYITGFSKLKADEKSFVTFSVNCTNLTEKQNVFLINIIPESKNFRTINHLCVIDN